MTQPVRGTNNGSAGNKLQSVLSEDGRRSATEDAIAADYKAYLPALSPDDPNVLSKDVKHMSLGDDSRLRTGQGMLKHQEDVADRNIAKWGSGSVHPSSRYGLPETTGDKLSARGSLGATLVEAVEQDERSRRDSLSVTDQSKPHHWDRKDWPTRVARDERSLGRRKHRGSVSSHSDDNDTRRRSGGLRHTPHTHDGGNTSLRTAFMDGNVDKGLESNQQRLAVRGPPLDEVVDLNDSVDTVQTTRWAPGKSDLLLVLKQANLAIS